MLYCTSTVTFGAASFLTGMLKRRILTNLPFRGVRRSREGCALCLCTFASSSFTFLNALLHIHRRLRHHLLKRRILTNLPFRGVRRSREGCALCLCTFASSSFTFLNALLHIHRRLRHHLLKRRIKTTIKKHRTIKYQY